MKILIVCDLFPPNLKGGYEIRCEEACHWLHKNGYNIQVLTTKTDLLHSYHPFPVYRIFEEYPLGKTPSNWLYSKKLFLAIKDNLIFKFYLAKLKPDLIYIWNLTGISRTLVPLIFSLSERKLVDVSSTWLMKVFEQQGPVYGPLHYYPGNKLKSIIKTFFRKLLPIISFGTIRPIFKLQLNRSSGYFTSQWNKQYHSQKIIECKKFKVIYTGIDISIFPFKEKAWDQMSLNFLYVGRIQKEKGFFLLIDQMHYLINHINLPVQLKILGKFEDQDMEQKTKDRISTFNMETNFIFIGQVEREDLAQYYHEADFTVFPSITNEAFSRIPLESLSCGTPCISTDNPGSKELFEKSAPLIFLNQSNEGLLPAIKPFVDNNEEYREICIDGRNFIEKYFSFDRFMNTVNEEFFTNPLGDE